MRILLVNYRYFLSGGPERYLFNVKTLLEEHGHTVIPFSVHSNRNVPTAYSSYFVEPIGGRDAVYYEDCKKTPKTIWQMLDKSIYSREVEKAVGKIIQDTKPDLVYTIHFVNKLSPSVLVGAKKMGVPVVCRLSDYFLLCPRFDFLSGGKICEECLNGGYGACLKKRCVKDSFFASLVRVLSMQIHQGLRIYENVDAFVTPSRFLKKKLTENGFAEKKIHCIPTFTAGLRDKTESKAGAYGLYFGRITEEKGVDTVVKAFAQMPSRIVKIVGDDTTAEARRLKAYVAAHQIQNVEFLGFQSGAELAQILQGARYTILPSLWYDNLPNTALESFGYGKPVIASNIGSLPELVEDGCNGFLFEPGNAQQLTEKIGMLDDELLVKKMGANAKKILAEKFTAENHYDALMGLFLHLTGENGNDSAGKNPQTS